MRSTTRPYVRGFEWMRQRRRRLVFAQLAALVTLVFAGCFGQPGTVQAAAALHLRPGTRTAGSGPDWSTYLGNPARSNFNSAETAITASTAPSLTLKWSYQTKGAISTQPVVSNGVVYVGSWDGYERAFHTSGKLLWATYVGLTNDRNCSPSKVGVASTATVATITMNGVATAVVFVGGGDAHFYALNAATGAVLWKTPIGTSPQYFEWASPLLYKGSIYEGISSFDDCPLIRGGLMQLNAATGAVQHTFYTVPAGCVGASVWGSPAVDAATSILYFATGNAGIDCSAPTPLGIAVVALNAANLSFVGSYQYPFYADTLDTDFGNTPTLFTATIGGIQRQMLGIANKHGEYFALDRTDLAAGSLWTDQVRTPIGGAPIGGGTVSPETVGGTYDDVSPSGWDGTTLYIVGVLARLNGQRCAGTIQAVDPNTGNFLWRQCLPVGTVYAAATVIPGLVIIGEGNTFEVLNATNGNVVFSFTDPNARSQFWGSASVSNGVLYIGNFDGLVYAFGLPGAAGTKR